MYIPGRSRMCSVEDRVLMLASVYSDGMEDLTLASERSAPVTSEI